MAVGVWSGGQRHRHVSRGGNNGHGHGVAEPPELREPRDYQNHPEKCSFPPILIESFFSCKIMLFIALFKLSLRN